MAQALTLAERQENYWKAFKAKETAFYESQAAFRVWEDVNKRYAEARAALDAAGAALINEANIAS